MHPSSDTYHTCSSTMANLFELVYQICACVVWVSQYLAVLIFAFQLTRTKIAFVSAFSAILDLLPLPATIVCHDDTFCTSGTERFCCWDGGCADELKFCGKESMASRSTDGGASGRSDNVKKA